MVGAYGLANCALNNSRECSSHRLKCTIMLCWSCDRITCTVKIGSFPDLLVENSEFRIFIYIHQLIIDS